MARSTAAVIQTAIEGAVAKVVARLSKSIERTIAERVAEELERQVAAPLKGRRFQNRAARRRRPVEITRWVADRRARRVPTFVIELTGGLDTKKKIVAKYGEGAVFEKGKPAPKAK